MICFLTSQMNHPVTDELNTANRFADELRRFLPDPCRVLYVCGDPDSPDLTDICAAATRGYLERADFRTAAFDVLDGRNEGRAEALLRASDTVILSGGHVPTQNRFFRRIRLRALMRSFGGTVIGISAGSMNSADTVYAQPEEPGESVDPAYRRFLPGLGLTKTMLLPHYQQVKDSVLDGRRLFEDITCGDSAGRTFYAIPDGSYLFRGPGGEELRGAAVMIRDGVMTEISAEGDAVAL